MSAYIMSLLNYLLEASRDDWEVYSLYNRE